MQKRILPFVVLALLVNYRTTAQTNLADPAENVPKTSWSFYNGAVSFTAAKFNKFIIDPAKPVAFWPPQPSGFVTTLAIMPVNGTTKPFIYTTGIGDAPGATEEGVVHFVDYDNFSTYGDIHFNFSTESAVSAHWGTEKFLEFADSHFGQKGFDKQGTIPINVFLTKSLEQGGVSPVRFDPLTKSILLGAGDPIYPYVSLDWIGYAMTKGILDQYGMAGSPGGVQLAYETADITNAFCNIMARCFENWHNKGSGKPINWVMGEHQLNQSSFFVDPLLLNHPSTYLGKYFDKFPFGNHYDYEVKQAYKNAEVIHFWFYLLTNGGQGYVNDDPNRPHYHVKPLDPDPYISSTKALSILFSAFTDPADRMKNGYGFNDFRRIALLKTAQNFGLEDELVSVREALKAVGLGNPVDVNCINYPTEKKSGQSFYNGVVDFNTLEVSLEPDIFPNDKANFLESCAESTHPAIETRNTGEEFIIDFEGDNTYSATNNFVNSQKSISIHWGTEQALNWFFKTVGQYGIDGNSPVKNSIVETEEGPSEPYFSSEDQTIHYNAGYSIPSISLDFVGKVITDGIYHSTLGAIPRNPDGTSTSPESEAIKGSLGDIFGRSMHNNYLTSHNKPSSWVFGGDLFENTSYLRSFSDPNSRDDPEYYKGNFYNSNPDFDDVINDAGSNNGILNKWFYLLVNGTGDNPNGDVNEKGEEYLIIGLGESKSIQLVYKAFTKFLKPNPKFEDFKEAIYKALEDSGEKDKKPSVQDAFFAVGLESERFQDHLKRFPKDGELVYPWRLKVGAQVEFKEESQRLFQVSKDPKFNPNTAPLYQFTNSVSASQDDGIMYGEVNLEPGQSYYIRSRLSNSGDFRHGCALSLDPVFCEMLKGKNKWTLIDEFTTDKVNIVMAVNPAPGDEIASWSSPFSWLGVKNAAGYDLHIIDPEGTIAEHNIPVDAYYDPEEPDKRESILLALSKGRKYSWNIAARQKLGSPKAVSVLPNGMTVALTDAEKEAFPNVYGKWRDDIHFTTDIPTLVPGSSPADGEHKPLIGASFVLNAEPIAGADYYQFEYKEPYYKKTDIATPEAEFMISNVPGITDQQEIKWAFTPVKKATAPFITEDETGGTEWRSFIADLGMSESPKQKNMQCTPAGEPLTFKWDLIPGAMDYRVTVVDRNNNVEVAAGNTSSNHITLDHVNEYPTPANYAWKVKAGIETNGQWLWAPESNQFYKVGPPAPTGLVPTAGDSPYGGTDLNQGGLTLNWQSQYAPDGYWLKLRRGNEDWVVDQKVLTNSVTIQGLKFDSNYHWEVKAIGDGGALCDWAEADFSTYGLGQNAISKIKVIEKVQEVNDGSDGGNGNGNPQDPEKACPGTFTVTMINSEQIEISLLTNKLGTSEVLEGTSDIYTNEYLPLLTNGYTVYPGGVYNQNDQIVLYIKVKAINGQWAELPADEIPEIKFTTSGGQVMTHKFNFSDWYLDKEIMMGTYHCANE